MSGSHCGEGDGNADTFITIVWYASDIKDRADAIGVDITGDEATEILHNVKRGHDCEQGINWDVIDCHIEMHKDGVL